LEGYLFAKAVGRVDATAMLLRLAQKPGDILRSLVLDGAPAEHQILHAETEIVESRRRAALTRPSLSTVFASAGPRRCNSAFFWQGKSLKYAPVWKVLRRVSRGSTMSEIIYSAADASGTTGLWVSNGTAGGTSEIAGEQGAYSLNPNDLTSLNNGEVVFNGVDSSGNIGFWITNDTSAGTYELSSLWPVNITVLGTNVYFAGYSYASEGTGLWVSNGTTSGTTEIEPPGNYDLRPYYFSPIGDLLFFVGVIQRTKMGFGSPIARQTLRRRSKPALRAPKI
jgi:hypothetical protein